MIGINNRDLTTLKVDIERTHELLGAGAGRDDRRRRSRACARARSSSGLASAGVDAVLVGEALMRSPDIEAACRELTGVAV